MRAMADEDDLHELERNLADLAVQLFAGGSVAATLERIVRLAETTVESCVAAGVLVRDDDVLRVAAASNALARELDERQIETGEGPCVDAAMTGESVYAEDLADESRWPAFAPAAVGAGVRTVLAYSLAGERQSALNLYAYVPAAFGASDRALGQLYATLARLAVDSAEERAASDAKAGNLTEGLRTRELIGQAQGILMERERITGDQAFDVLRRASQRMNIKLRDIAETVVRTGEAPKEGKERGEQRRRDSID